MTATMAEPFVLHAFVRDVVDNTEYTDPHLIASEVAGLVPEPLLREALAQCVIHAVRGVLQSEKSQVREATRTDREPGAKGRWADAAAIRRAFLRQPAFTGEKWKPQGDCTRDEVMVMSQIRMDQAKATAVEAERFKKLAAAMTKAKADTVADVPEPVLLEVLRWQP